MEQVPDAGLILPSKMLHFPFVFRDKVIAIRRLDFFARLNEPVASDANGFVVTLNPETDPKGVPSGDAVPAHLNPDSAVGSLRSATWQLDETSSNFRRRIQHFEAYLNGFVPRDLKDTMAAFFINNPLRFMRTIAAKSRPAVNEKLDPMQGG